MELMWGWQATENAISNGHQNQALCHKKYLKMV